jgi:hypothetical protein
VIRHILLTGDVTAIAWSGSRPRYVRFNSHGRQTERAWRLEWSINSTVKPALFKE